jgi:hypothetical protein
MEIKKIKTTLTIITVYGNTGSRVLLGLVNKIYHNKSFRFSNVTFVSFSNK